ncbi:gliding motility-associated C-terminal domain-containing protein [Flagellimonas pelagia]|uniref:Gliding motility-associated C-terminal domain-containing protein n=1 Tax=Flagellimonas pelagia TaxID=2306998 RepID=A0A3A1NLR6_9FLAO|nr:gliding motility-associated C-terminal domain-containing protein [Allomuricauda maritima]RIV47103.1 gliding motility-associated C-terminal domain-containing protein [Allomuricauda maritima]TXK00799.1 gliding motility-associated C-terminal domain-containing protein [Allomuricauda maritima]
MENITFVRLRGNLVHHVQVVALLLGVGLFSSFGVAPSYHSSKIRTWSDHVIEVDKTSTSSVWDISGLWDPFFSQSNDHHINSIGIGIAPTDCDGDGVTCDKEEEDGTDPEDPCDFILAHQNCTPTSTWKNMDCDGDGVTNQKEKEDGTDPLDPCDLVVEHQNCTVPDSWKKMDCDGDGVTNEKEIEDGTDPFDPCDLVVEHQNCTVSNSWKNMDCDGDGVTNGKEKEDGTDPFDPCDFVWEHQNCTPSDAWKQLDCDGDGVTNGDEKEDGTDPLDPCDYNPDHVTLPQSGDYLSADCDGDGVTNEKEIEDGTDPLDPCDFVLEHQNCTPSDAWKQLDCDGDGVTNGDEKEDGTDPLDPCDYNPDHVTLPQSGDYLTADCDGDGVTNGDENEDGTDPNDACDFVLGSQTVDPSSTWNSSDCDGDGVTNGDEKEDGTDPLDPCDYNPDHVTLPQSGDYLTADCDGDGVTNGDENEDGTDPNDACDFVLGSQTVDPSSTWNSSDCDGDGVTNGDEKEDGTDPLDPCDYKPESVTLTPSADWEALDCDNDGNPNGTDPNPLKATAMDDSGSTPALTQVAINILENDDYLPNNDENNLGITTLSQIGGNALGTVTFDADTGLMTYTPVLSESNSTVTVIYQVCNVAVDPNVCASATVTIQVGANTLDAVDDTYVSDTNGGTISDSNVLDNDTLNGTPVTPGDVILTSTPTDELTINEDGSITVNPGTSEGTYTISYTICEAANPSNCDTATVTVEVTEGASNIIDAVDDAYNTDTNGGTISDSNVLNNDTLNGTPVGPGDIILTSTPTDELTINEDGTITVNPGIPEGTYTISYTICEAANPSNCDTATVTVEVTEGMTNVIDAVNDSFNADTTGGIISGSSVLDNDTLNGASITLEDVILNSTPTDELTINEDGSVSVNPGTAQGTYTITYTICETANMENCDTATVTVVVTEGMTNVIDAVDDAYTGDTTSGMITDSNVLDNDTLNGVPVTLADVILTSTPTDELTINEDGSVSVNSGTIAGTYTITYTICEATNLENCDTATVTVEVTEGMANVIDAVDDLYETDSHGGVIPGSNVLSNDTLNGEPVTLADVILTSSPTNVLTINPDGSVSVVSDTKDGTYTIEYTICEIANPDNCDTAIVTVVVEGISVNQLVTPNGDLKNDFLYIRGTDKIKSSTLKIFNRWGVAVYEGENYDNVRNVFDGRSRGRSSLGVNDYLPAGVYFYIFNYETDEGSFTDSEYIYISR